MKKVMIIILSICICSIFSSQLMAQQKNAQEEQKKVVAQQKNCADKVKSEVLQSLMKLKEGVSQLEVINDVCNSRSAKKVDLFEGKKSPKRKQYKNMRDYLCKKNPKKHSSYLKAQRSLKDWLSESQRKSIKQCVNAQKKV